MTTEASTSNADECVDPDCVERVRRLRKINSALMDRVERSIDHQGNAFSLFQTAINLEGQVRRRTEELLTTLNTLEEANAELISAKDQAEQANQSKTRFLAAASHDVMQPLNAAMLLMSTLSDLQTSNEAGALAAQVQRSLHTVEELLGTLMDISRLDAGVVDPVLEEIDLAALLRSLQSDFTPLAEQRGIELRLRLQNLHVISDRTMLRRVLQNIVSNAIRYTPTGGVLVACRPRGDTCRIDVVDTGIGIAPDQSAIIFEEFHRGATDIPIAAGETCTGLGLSIVKRMCQRLDHQLGFYSREGKGTWFHVELPISASRKRAEYTQPEQRRSIDHSRQQGMLDCRILLIENDPDVLNAMQRLLENWHCDVRDTTQPQDALAIATNDWQPDVVIADQQLDHHQLGLDTILALRQQLKRSVPAVIVTANPTPELRQQASREDIELMAKPVRPAQLRALLTHVTATG